MGFRHWTKVQGASGAFYPRAKARGKMVIGAKARGKDVLALKRL